MTSEEVVEVVTAALRAVFSLPTALVVLAVMFRGPLSDLVRRFRSANVHVGSLRLEVLVSGDAEDIQIDYDALDDDEDPDDENA